MDAIVQKRLKLALLLAAVLVLGFGLALNYVESHHGSHQHEIGVQ